MGHDRTIGGSFRPYHMGRVAIFPEGKPYFFHVVLNPEAYVVVGVLRDILDVFAGEKVPILLFKTSTPPRGSGEDIRVIIAADIKEDREAEKIVAALRRKRFVKEAEYAPPVAPGIGLDAWSYPPVAAGERAIVFREQVFRRLVRFGWEHLGSGYGGILYRTFFEAGREVYENFYKRLGLGKEDLVRLAEEMFRLMGFGILRIVELTNDRMVAQVYDNVECKSLVGIEGAEGTIIRGLLAGWLSGYWGVDIKTVRPKETKCIARGDPYCEYVFRRGSYDEEVRAQ
ncbi:V4R domain-containing protein [Thermofilum pendens]|uniref:4-vinyl reductase, 4VR n=1 Tax=Thermofilum pendens (strain DSM 2475 / Hrk 5) TaxID=368408 RepID=A1S0P7_THEPD|nr:4-vinyl reductase 4VR [Thermofilum pendens]ABL79027.1 4-vinyl reductase, 4VR [Thermofilum pendens Hrk 5]